MHGKPEIQNTETTPIIIVSGMQRRNSEAKYLNNHVPLEIGENR
jgi:hypothetical protein